jgi:rod shape-determining protein MreC
MASPTLGRRSYARRAQYGAFVAYLVALTGVIAGLMAAIVWVVDPVGFGNLRVLANEAVAPVGRVVNGGSGVASNSGDWLGSWWRAGSQNADLKARLERANIQVRAAQGLQSENRELRALLGLAQGDVRPVTTARLLSTSASSTRRYAILDAGHGDGVRTGQPVRSATGLIGRTLEVGPSVSRVLLITDSRNVVPARRARDGLAVLVNGRGDDLLDVRTLNTAGAELKVGDILIASGSGGLYQPRTPVARIVRLTTDGALARPLAVPESAVAVLVEPASAVADEPPPVTVSDAAEESETNAPQGVDQ